MGIFDSLTGASQRRDVREGLGVAQDHLIANTEAANNNLRTGYNTANQTLRQGMGQGMNALSRGTATARGDINTATANARSDLQGANRAVQPYYQQGTRANTMYGNALGINGGAARAQAQNTYMSDPIMEALMNQSNENVLKRYNASGLSNSGVSRAAILQNQYNNYGGWLDRLNGQGQMGFQAAGQMGQNATNMANLETQRGNALANLAAQLGQNQADMGFRYQTQEAGNRVNLGRDIANNSVNLGQQRANLVTGASSALANTRGMGWQNALNIGSSLLTGGSNGAQAAQALKLFGGG